MANAASGENRNVFINCPLDVAFSKLLRAALFTIVDSGYEPRCALEADNAHDNRIDKIYQIIGQSRFAIHDLSRTGLGRSTRLPRFNMPIELGIDLGCRKFGDAQHKQKRALVTARKKYDFHIFASDVSGIDIRAHNGQPAEMIKAVRYFLRSATGDPLIPGPATIEARFDVFEWRLPYYCRQSGFSRLRDMHYLDLKNLMSVWCDEVKSLPVGRR